MKRILRFVFAVALVGALATGASAYTEGVIPNASNVGTNDFLVATLPATPIFTGPAIGGYYGAQLYLAASGPVDITAQYWGAEAGYVNTFKWGGTTVFTHNGVAQDNDIPANFASEPKSSTTISSVNPGLLNFSFTYNNGAGSVVNGSNPDDATTAGAGANFFVTFNPFESYLNSATPTDQPTYGQSVWVFLDDGNVSDDNHDDFLVKLSVTGGQFTTVPIPAAVWLLGSGLMGLAGIRRRFMK